MHHSSPPATRLFVAAALAAGLLLLGAAPASAHVEATAGDGAQAGDGPVTVAFVAEAESSTAGIASTKTQLPAGVLPEWVSLAAGPPGWTLITTADGYEVGGAALAPGTNAEYTVSIGQLPADRTELTFKTLVRYTDGQEDAWIEDPTPGNPEPQHPAPVVTVAPAAAPAATTAPSSAPASSAPASSAPASSAPATPTTSAQADAASDDGTPGWAIALGVLAVALVLVGGLWVWRMRSRSRA